MRQRAFPSARACFEAAQQALMLASDTNYDLAGAKAWVYAHRKDLRQGRQAEEAGLLDDLPDHLPAHEYYAKRFTEMQESWNRFAPGKGKLLNDAEVALDAQPRTPDNWAGVNIAEALEQRLEAMPNPEGIQLPPTRPSLLLRSAYALLSRESHPHSSRLEPTNIRGDVGDAVEFTFRPENSAEPADLAEVLTISALNLALASFAMRVRITRGA
jgi:hypothetical protein